MHHQLKHQENPDCTVYSIVSRLRRYLSQSGLYIRNIGDFEYANAAAAADVLEDAEIAINSFIHDEQWTDEGGAYLATYGALQAAYMQRDAVRVLREAVALPFDPVPQAINAICSIRNRAVGHPSELTGPPKPRKKIEKGEATATFIARHSIAADNLVILMIKANGERIRETYNVRQMLVEHVQELKEWLIDVVANIEEREALRKANIASKGPMSSILHPSWDYMSQKINEAGYAEDINRVLVAKASIPTLEGMLKDIANGLKDREIDMKYFLHDNDIAEKALQRTGRLLDKVDGNDATNLDIAAYGKLIYYHFQQIKQYLDDLDAAVSAPSVSMRATKESIFNS